MDKYKLWHRPTQEPGWLVRLEPPLQLTLLIQEAGHFTAEDIEAAHEAEVIPNRKDLQIYPVRPGEEERL